MGSVRATGGSGGRSGAVLVVQAPLAGRVEPLEVVPDPVFAAGMVGPGVAVDPVVVPGAEPVPVRAPIAGVLVKVHPHAFVVQGTDGIAVLVHLGIDTVRLAGAGFVPVLAEGASVAAGDVVTRWDVGSAVAAGYRVICPVVVLEADVARLAPLAAAGSPVVPGAAMLSVRAG